MAGYNDTRDLIISALMGRPAGTEIQPENHQAYALNMLDYIRSVELVSTSTLIGIAEENTVPIQPNDSRVCYIAGVGQDRTVTFSNFIDDEGNPISITTGEMEGVFVILLWNMEHWVAYTFNTNIISSAESANFYYGYNIRKTYASVAAMNADSVNPIGTDGRLIKIGELVTVVNSTTPAENGYYSYEGSENGWLLQSGFSFEIVQTTGTDINKAMSQKAVTDELAQLAGEVDGQFIIKDLNNSWIQVAEGSDNDILYTSLVKDVNIWLDKSLYPDGVEIGIGLIRNRVDDKQLRFKIKNTSGVWNYLSPFIIFNSVNENGETEFFAETSTVKITGTIDWRLISPNISGNFPSDLQSVIVLLKQSRIHDISDLGVGERLMDELNTYYSKDIFTSSAMSFVPNVSKYLGHQTYGRTIITTPYKLSDNHAYVFELMLNSVDASAPTGDKIILSFWGRDDNTFNYTVPSVKYYQNWRPLKIQLATNSEGFICIILGEDNIEFKPFGRNQTLVVERVHLLFQGTLTKKMEGWSITNEITLPASYTNVTDTAVIKDPGPPKSAKEVVSQTSNTSIFIPKISKTINGSAAGVNKGVKITLPENYAISDGIYYEVELSLSDIDTRTGKGIQKARVAWWGRSDGTIGSYGRCYKDEQFDFLVRICLDENNRYAILLDGYFAGNSKLIVSQMINWRTSKTEIDGWDIDDYSDETGFTQIYTPKVVKAISKDETYSLLENSNALPIKPKNFNIFGSSKSTTRYATTGWLYFLLQGLMKRAGYNDEITGFGRGTGVSNRKRFTDRSGKKITGVGSYLEFQTYGDNVNIVQLIERTSDYGEFNIYVNDVLFGNYNNRNKTIEAGKSITFTGDGVQRSFVLPDVDSYNFNVTLGGVPQIVTMTPSYSEDVDCYAVRTILPNIDGEVVRVIHFPNAPASGSIIEVNYDKGRAIGYIQSDYNEDEIGNTESFNPIYISDLNSAATFPGGYPLMPVVANDESVIRLNFDSYGWRKIKIELTGGVNPYFNFDFSVSEWNGWMNGAFGGWDLPRMLNEQRFRDWRGVRYNSNPEVTLLEFGTNDDRYEIDRVFVKEVNMTESELRLIKMKDVVYIDYNGVDDYNVGLCYDSIAAITAFTLQSDSIKTSNIEVGDYVKIGQYYSSWREFVVRKISEVDLTTGTITWDSPINTNNLWHYKNLSDLVGSQFSVRRLGQFKTNFSNLIDKIRLACPSSDIKLIGMSAFNNNGYCSGWAYDEAMEDVAHSKGCEHIQIWQEQVRYNEGALVDSILIDIPNTGVNEYVVPAASITNKNREMRVIVDGIDVTGISAYVERKDGWYLDELVSGSSITLPEGSVWSDVTAIANDRDGDVVVHFYNNVPTGEETIQLMVANSGWSDDGVHQSVNGNQTYANCILKSIV